ncbi:hypothetical protein A5755_11975 [Mycolicibacterium fortuitum]|nr:hypothetical protein [Mycolicibacterium fortuitum]NOQ58467.1 hypothetical protein [Mycolicibacterium fortuitum]OBB25484.1 hypothetical protein A5763_18905 [Mycolicibacterium fortuitum]OBB40656.1 hypothetical protein A5754_18850 [Mycolicibacterium fortuitum]OBB76494.1 hypothetical protein A5755_11975 [Mycolicibacterium fortuitum]OBF82271.1 hypothetical protein A5751_15590 [Mycolicibacterium fortuitum]
MTGISVPSGSIVHRLSTPRAAGLAGVVFAILFAATQVLIHTAMPQSVGAHARWTPGDDTGITTVTVLMPFVGISFLWFLAVVRDGFGRMEDRFYATVFLGSGLLFVAMIFVATAVAAGLIAVGGGDDSGVQAVVVDFATAVMVAASKTYALRMAAVFMISLATIWLKTALMPLWLALASYLTALTLLVVSDRIEWATLAFPVWVFVVSVMILLRGHRIAAVATVHHRGDRP